MSAQTAGIKSVVKTSKNLRNIQKQEDFVNQKMHREEDVIRAFQEAVARAGGQHYELSDVAYFKLLLEAKYKKDAR